MLTRAAAVPGPGAHGADTLGGDHEVGPSALEPPAEDLLGASHCVEAPAEWVDVGGVEKGDPARRRAIEDGNRGRLVALHAEGHRAETQTRDGQARAAESDVAHDLWDQHDLAIVLRLYDRLVGARRPGGSRIPATRGPLVPAWLPEHPNNHKRGRLLSPVHGCGDRPFPREMEGRSRQGLLPPPAERRYSPAVCTGAREDALRAGPDGGGAEGVRASSTTRAVGFLCG